jgi:TRAP-type C4-dicarboxylate transport system permease small subunit
MFDLLRRAEQRLALLGRIAAVAFLAIALLFTLGQVVDRYGPGIAFNAYDQVAQLALVWLTFLGIALALRDRVNIRVDVIDGWLGPRLLRLRDAVSDLVAIALLAIVQAKIWALVTIGSGQVIMGTPFSMSATFLALAAGSALAIALLAIRLVLELADGVPR